MPITNFLEYTEVLSIEEKEIIPLLIEGFKTKSKDNPIKAPEIIAKMNAVLIAKRIKYKLTQPRLRQMCNHIRVNGMLPLIATSRGYYVSNDKNEIKSQIASLNERANSIIKSAKGLEVFL